MPQTAPSSSILHNVSYIPSFYSFIPLTFVDGNCVSCLYPYTPCSCWGVLNPLQKAAISEYV